MRIHYEVEVLVKIKKVGEQLMKSLRLPIMNRNNWV